MDTFTIGRRTLLGGGLAVLATTAVPAAALRQAPRINGNLALWLDDEKPLDRAMADSVRAARLDLAKQTLGGPGTSSFAETMAEIDACDRAIALNPRLYRPVRGPADLLPDPAGRLGVILSFEASEMLAGKLDNIDRFRARDVLVMGLSYNLQTPFASGVMTRQGTGLTELGRAAVARMNALGITVDVSHSDEASSLAAVAASTQPILITHAGCAAIHPHPRNKSDRLIRALAARGGVIGIYELSYLTGQGQPTLEIYLAHLTHALKTGGEDHVGIGTDSSLIFDTSPESMRRWDEQTAQRKALGVAAPGEGPPPFVTGLNRADRFDVIARALRRRGYPARVADKVLGGNFARVFGATWQPTRTAD